MSQESESPSPSRVPRVGSPFRLKPKESMLTLMVACTVFFLLIIQFEQLNFMALLFLVVMFGVGICFKRIWAIYLMFASLVVFKFSNVAPYMRVHDHNLGTKDLLFTLVALTLAGLCFRYFELARIVSGYYPTLNFSGTKKDTTRYQFPSLLGGRWWVIPIAIFSAAIMLWAFPYDATGARKMWMTPSGMRLIFLTFFVFVIWYVCRTIATLWIRWNLDAEQASVSSRSMIARVFWKDNLSLEKRRAKIRASRGPE